MLTENGTTMIDTTSKKIVHPWRNLTKIFIFVGLVFCVLGLSGCQQMMRGILNPKGVITYQERQLFFDALALMLIVVLPVFIMSFAFILRYHAKHKTADYKPNWNYSLFL